MSNAYFWEQVSELEALSMTVRMERLAAHHWNKISKGFKRKPLTVRRVARPLAGAGSITEILRADYERLSNV